MPDSTNQRLRESLLLIAVVLASSSAAQSAPPWDRDTTSLAEPGSPWSVTSSYAAGDTLAIDPIDDTYTFPYDGCHAWLAGGWWTDRRADDLRLPDIHAAERWYHEERMTDLAGKIGEKYGSLAVTEGLASVAGRTAATYAGAVHSAFRIGRDFKSVYDVGTGRSHPSQIRSICPSAVVGWEVLNVPENPVDGRVWERSIANEYGVLGTSRTEAWHRSRQPGHIGRYGYDPQDDTVYRRTESHGNFIRITSGGETKYFPADASAAEIRRAFGASPDDETFSHLLDGMAGRSDPGMERLFDYIHRHADEFADERDWEHDQSRKTYLLKYDHIYFEPDGTLGADLAFPAGPSRLDALRGTPASIPLSAPWRSVLDAAVETRPAEPRGRLPLSTGPSREVDGVSMEMDVDDDAFEADDTGRLERQRRQAIESRPEPTSLTWPATEKDGRP